MSKVTNIKKNAPPDDFTNDNHIETFLHCALCIKEKPDGVSPQEWTSLEAGMTLRGLQIWCKRHDCNLIHVDFEDQIHPAITSRKRREGE